MDSCTCRPRCGGPPRTQPGHSPADSRWPQCSCTFAPRPSRSPGQGPEGQVGRCGGVPQRERRPREGGGGAVGAGPPFHPKERGPPTKHSLLLSHSTNEVSDRRRRKQAATFWRNRDQVRARRLRPSPAARAGTPPPCSPPPPASTRHSCLPAGGHGLPWALRAQKAPLWSARRCPRPAGGERPVHLCRVAGLTSEWAPGP